MSFPHPEVLRPLIERWREDEGGTYRRGSPTSTKTGPPTCFSRAFYPRAPAALVAPDDREEDVRRQLARPAIMQAVSRLRVQYIPYGELERNREAIARFGEGLKPIEALARSLG